MNLITIKKVCERTGKSRSGVYDAINKGKFPTPVRIGERRIAFVEAEIDEWIAARIAERNGVWLAAE